MIPHVLEAAVTGSLSPDGRPSAAAAAYCS